MSNRQHWIVDFGSQYTQLITRKCRESGVSSEILTVEDALALFRKGTFPKALILSGGPQSVFEDAGWLAGPAAWAVCAALCAVALRLPLLPVLVGAALAGVPSLVTVLLGAHWLGVPLAVAIFGVWCGALADRTRTRRIVPQEA